MAVEYSGLQDFKKVAKKLRIMDDEKDGIPRTSYKGIVETWRGEVKLVLVPAVIQM